MDKNKNRLSLDEIKAETKHLVAELAFAARAPVDICFAEGDSIAYTVPTTENKPTITLALNPDVIANVRNKERAIAIWRGMGFHELAHHLWAAHDQYKQAIKEGIKPLFNLLDDEQNERRGRALDADWGACFQTLCTHIFPHKNRNNQDKLEVGALHADDDKGKATRKPPPSLYSLRWNQFAYHLRRHELNPSDPVVAKALAAIPRRFKDLSKDELLDLTRRIHKMLSQDVVFPKDEPPENEEPDKETEEIEEDEAGDPEESEPDEENSEEEEEQENEDAEDADSIKKTWRLKKLLRSKWAYAGFAAIILAWCALLSNGSAGFWARAAMYFLLAVGVCMAILFLRWAAIKAVVKANEKLDSGTPQEREERVSKINKRVLTGGGSLLVIVVILLLISLLGLPGLIISALLASAAGFGMLARKLKKRPKLSKRQRIYVKANKLTAALSVVALLAYIGRLMFVAHAQIWVFGTTIAGIIVAATVLFCLIFRPGPKINAGVNSIMRRKIDFHFKRSSRSFKDTARALGRIIGAALLWLVKLVFKAISVTSVFIWRVCVAVAKYLWHLITVTARAIARLAVAIWRALVKAKDKVVYTCGPTLRKMWQHPTFRLVLLALPAAILIMMIYGVFVTAGQQSWWLLIILAVLLLILSIVGWLYRKQIVRFIVQELLMPMPQLMDFGMPPPLDMDTPWFNQVHNIQQVLANQTVMDEMLPQARLLAQQLRPYLARCGNIAIDRDDQLEGFDLIEEAELALVGEPAIFIDDDMLPKASLHLEVALDCSGSMDSATVSLKPGEKFQLGKLFSLALEQATFNLPGVSAHFWGFTHTAIYDCGLPGEGRSSGLICGGGNNDAAMLWHMGQSARNSGKDVKILLMLSDGQPSDCSWLSLKNVVAQFEQEGMIPWNFALDEIGTPAFERFFTDLVGQSLEEAIITMGQTLAAIAEAS